MATACPLCYQDYAMGVSEGDTVPRQLPCGDITCTACLRDVLVDCELVCQLCMKTYQYADVAEIPIWPGATDEEHSDTESICSDTSDISYNSYSDTDDTGSDSSDRSPRQSLSPTGNSKLADFMEATATAAGRPFRRSGSDDKKGPTKSCTIPGCPNRRGPRGYCASHSTSTHLNIESAKRATRKLERAKLSRLTFKPGDRIKEMKNSESASPWGRVDPDELAARFKRHELLELGEVLELIDQSREVLMKESNVLQVQAPVTAVGDIHGQFFDLLHLIENGGKPGVETSYLFLGDYVDRGKYSCEVILYLLALKVQYPKRIFLIRGNHESRGTTGYFGFKEECKAKYGLPVYYRFLLCFECLPLCALIQTSYGRIFACHGGISPDIRTLNDIESISRFVEPECKGALCDILWSDPLHEPRAAEMEERFDEFMGVEWKPNYERGCSFYFGYKAVRRFLDENDLLCLVRAHQVQEEGYRRHFYAMDRSSSLFPGSPLTSSNVRKLLPPVITIFSAPNYIERYGNKAAFLRIGLEPNELSFEQFDCTPTSLPSGMSNDLAMSSAHHLAIIKTCPYMPTTFRELFKVAMELGAADAPPPTSPVIIKDDTNPSLSSSERPSSPETMSPLLPTSPTASSRGGGGGGGGRSGFDRGGAVSPTFGSRMGGALATSSAATTPNTTPSATKTGGSRRISFGTTGGKREEKAQPLHRAFFYSDPGKALRTRSIEEMSQNSSTSTPTTTSSSSSSSSDDVAAVGGGAADNGTQGGHHRISVIRTPQPIRPGITTGPAERPKGAPRKSTVTLKREVRSEAIKTRSSLYMLAAARDGINEMHPEILEKRIQVIADELLIKDKDSGDDGKARGGGMSEGCQEAHQIQGRRFSVSELCHRFEKGMLGQKLGDLAMSDEAGDPEGRGDDCQHRRHGSLENLKLTANSVTELRDFFELLSRKNAERRQGDKPSPGVRRSGGSSSQSGANRTGKGLATNLPPLPEANTMTQEGKPLPPAPPSSLSSSLSSSSTSSGLEGKVPGGPSIATPAAEVFTHDEIVTLRLIFSLFDDNGDDYLDMQELMRYSEETGDYALPSQAMECIRVIDVDGDGRIGLWDYINFAARLKELHRVNQHSLVMCEIKKRSLMASSTV